MHLGQEQSTGIAADVDDVPVAAERPAGTPGRAAPLNTRP